MPTERASEPRPLSSNWRMRAMELNHFITTSYLTHCRVPIDKAVAEQRTVALFMPLFIFCCSCKRWSTCVIAAQRHVKSGVMPEAGLFSAQCAVKTTTSAMTPTNADPF